MRTRATVTVGVAERARRLTERLRRAPLPLVKTELGSLVNILHSDEAARVLLLNLVERERPRIGGHSGSFIKGQPLPHQIGLEFADSPERRAALGYQILTGLLEGDRLWTDVANVVARDGSQYVPPLVVASEPGTTHTAEAISRFVDVFIDPIVDYLENAHDTDDLVLAAMVRYKQRSEWFEKEQLQSAAMDGIDGEMRGQVEERLKRAFYRYLFDQGLEFSIEAESPAHGGRADVLSGRLRDGRRLVVEAKVYDGKGRNARWVKDGIKQTAAYAGDWAEPNGYLLVYNLALNTALKFSGVREMGNLCSTQSLMREVRIVTIDAADRPPASKASEVQEVVIDCAD